MNYYLILGRMATDIEIAKKNIINSGLHKSTALAVHASLAKKYNRYRFLFLFNPIIYFKQWINMHTV